jgi:peptidyl-tRNA hydrolase, PTH2 family
MATIYYVVNTSLNMGVGKIAAQCCHVNTDIIKLMEKCSKSPRLYREWKLYGETTVVLAADEEQFAAIYNEFKELSLNSPANDTKYKTPVMCYIVDAGRTEVEPGTMTVLGFTPMRKHEAPECIKVLKTLNNSHLKKKKKKTVEIKEID